MTELLSYTLQVLLCHGVLFLIYWVFLKRQKAFAFNRVYLMAALAAGLLFPKLHLYPLEPTPILELHEQFVEPWAQPLAESITLEKATVTIPNSSGNIAWVQYLVWALALGSVICLSRYFGQLWHLFYHTKNKDYVIHCKYKLYPSTSQEVFSVFSHIFIPKDYWGIPEFDTLLIHEAAHARHAHSLDRLIVDFIIALFWFNPFIYLIRRELIAVHEYQADATVLQKHSDRIAYQELLFSFVTPRSFAMASSLGAFSIKNRIKMMNKEHNSRRSGFAITITVILSSMVALGFAMEEHKSRAGVTLLGGPWSDPFEQYAPGIWSKPAVPVPSIFPVDQKAEHRISSEYGWRKNPWTGQKQFHTGLDVIAPVGTEVYATADGVVEEAQVYKNAWGHNVIIQHDDPGYKTRYAHMDRFIVKSGEKVKQGQVIGYVGNSGKSTGPHLHYGVTKDGNHVDPWSYITDYEAER